MRDENATYGEDYNPGGRVHDTERKVYELKDEIKELWKAYSKIEAALIGPDGKDGIRGTMQDHYNRTDSRMDKMEVVLDRVSKDVSTVSGDLRELIIILKTITKVGTAVAALLATGAVVLRIVELL